MESLPTSGCTKATYKRDCLKLPNVASNEPCAHCTCNTTDVPWYDFRAAAAWVQKQLTLQQWKNSPWKTCTLMRAAGVSHRTIVPDWMHDKNPGTDKVRGLFVLIPECLVGGGRRSMSYRVFNEMSYTMC